MTREAYIAELKRQIGKLPPADVKDIVADYEEHFYNGTRSGKTEAQIAEGLGQPKAVAKEILMNNLVTKAEASTTVMQKSEVLLRMMVAFLIFAPLKLIKNYC
jgi:uncharacterized membrane protein